MELLTPCSAARAERLCQDLLSWAVRHLPPLAVPDRQVPSLLRAPIAYTVGADGIGYLPIEAWKQGRVDLHGLTPILSEMDAVTLMREEVLGSHHAALAWLEDLRAGREALAPLCSDLLDAVPYLHTPHARVALFLLTKRPGGEHAVQVPRPFDDGDVVGLRAAFQAPNTPAGFPDFPGLDLTASYRPRASSDAQTMDDASLDSPPFPVLLPRFFQRLSAFRPGERGWAVRGGEMPRFVWANSPAEAILLERVCTTSSYVRPLEHLPSFKLMQATEVVDHHAMMEAYSALHRATHYGQSVGETATGP